MKPSQSVRAAATRLWQFIVANPTYRHNDYSESNEQLTDELLRSARAHGFNHIGTGTRRLVLLGTSWVLKTEYGNFDSLKVEYNKIRSLRFTPKFRKHLPKTILWNGRVLIQERVMPLTKKEFFTNYSTISKIATSMNIGDLYYGNVGVRNGTYVFFDLEFTEDELRVNV